MNRWHEIETHAAYRQTELLRQVQQNAQLQAALRAQPMQRAPLFRLTLRYVRYALSTLATVGFGLKVSN